MKIKTKDGAEYYFDERTGSLTQLPKLIASSKVKDKELLKNGDMFAIEFSVIQK